MKQHTTQIERDTFYIAHIGDEDQKYYYTVGKRANLVFIALIDAKKSVTATIDLRLVGEYAKATCMGIVRGSSNADIIMQTLQHHQAPNTTSNLLVKAVLDDASTFHMPEVFLWIQVHKKQMHISAMKIYYYQVFPMQQASRHLR